MSPASVVPAPGIVACGDETIAQGNAVPDLRSLEIFYWVVQLGGFRRAADRLNTSQPAVSARIAGLEATLGTRLLDRERNRTRPTAAGNVLLGYAERMLALRADLLDAMQGSGDLRGTVRLGVSETIVHTRLGRVMQAMQAAHPRVTVDVVVDVSAQLRAGLVGGALDVAFLLGPVAAPGVRDLPLGTFPLAWIARPGLVAAATPALAEWTRFPIFTYARGTGPYEELSALFGDLPVRLFANTALSAVVRMVLDGIGVGVVAAATVAEYLDDGRLVILPGPALSPLVYTASTTRAPGTIGGILASLAASIDDPNP